MDELKTLSEAIKTIQKIAKDFELDFFDMRFEICPADILYTIGAYGMPTRFRHWSFGKAFHKLKTQYDYNLSRIYELVINSDPCYAFLLEGNSLIQNKMIIAHVYAHCDFFKNNSRFKYTNRQMVDSMAESAERIATYEFKYGRTEVEQFLDSALSIQEHIDPYLYIKQPQETEQKHQCCKKSNTKIDKKYQDLLELDDNVQGQCRNGQCQQCNSKAKNSKRSHKDIIKFLLEHNRRLKPWQQDILSIVREEMLYFWPQLETKIMNEGWASYWHARIIRQLDLSESEVIEFAKLHASVVQPSKYNINPYYLGMKLWEDIEQRYGREKMFEIRSIEADIGFLRNYLTEKFVTETDMYLFKKVGYQWQVTDIDWKQVRDGLVNNLINGGFPVIEVTDGDYNLNGELYLEHRYEGIELDIKYLEKTLQHVYYLWGRPVHLETIIDDSSILFTYNGERNSKKLLKS